MSDKPTIFGIPILENEKLAPDEIVLINWRKPLPEPERDGQTLTWQHIYNLYAGYHPFDMIAVHNVGEFMDRPEIKALLEEE